MPGRASPIVSAIVVLFITASLGLGMNGRALAGSECIEQPSREPSQGEHWFYHYDRGKSRKCWHLGADAMKPREAAALEEHSDAASRSTFNSAFSSLFRGLTTTPSVALPDPAASEPRIIQSDPTKPLKLEDIAQQQTDIPEERADPRYVTPLNPARRRALFLEFLRWNEIQRNLGDGDAPAPSR